jgi:hypothetical protein
MNPVRQINTTIHVQMDSFAVTLFRNIFKLIKSNKLSYYSVAYYQGCKRVCHKELSNHYYYQKNVLPVPRNRPQPPTFILVTNCDHLLVSFTAVHLLDLKQHHQITTWSVISDKWSLITNLVYSSSRIHVHTYMVQYSLMFHIFTLEQGWPTSDTRTRFRWHTTWTY